MAKRTRAPARRSRAMKAVRRKPARKQRHYTITYLPGLLENGRRRFEGTSESLESIAADFGIDRKTLSRLAEKNGWTRFVRPPRMLSPAARLLLDAEKLEAGPPPAHDNTEPAAPGEATASADVTAMIERITRAVQAELDCVEALRATLRREPQSPRDAERTARTLSSLTETLQKLQRLQCGVSQPGSLDDDMPADIDEFRDELARQIDQFVASRAQPADSGGSGA